MKKVPKLRFPEFEGEWENEKIGNITRKVGSGKTPKGGKSVYTDSGVVFLRSQNVLNGKLSLNDVAYISENENNNMKSTVIYGNDILLNITGASIGRSCVVPKIFHEANVNQHVCIIRLKEKYNPFFIMNQILSYKVQKQIDSYQAGGNREGLNFQQIKEISISDTTYEEQEKIATFFSLIDKKIVKQQEKVEALEEYKKGMMHKIFSQEVKFKDKKGDSNNDWRKVKIGECFSERSERGFSDLELLAVTINNGITQRSAIGAKDNSSEDKSNYKLVKQEDIVYNSMRMWQGASGVSKFTGIVSPAYTVLIPSENICSDFFGYLFKTHKMIYEFKKYSQGLTSDTWNLKYQQIKDISIRVPPLSEQNSVCEFFKSIDQKMLLEKEKLEYLNQWKKGLVQQMFVYK